MYNKRHNRTNAVMSFGISSIFYKRYFGHAQFGTTVWVEFYFFRIAKGDCGIGHFICHAVVTVGAIPIDLGKLSLDGELGAVSPKRGIKVFDVQHRFLVPYAVNDDITMGNGSRDATFLVKDGTCSLNVKETGKTPLVYIAELRIGRAKVQLENSDLALYEVARSCGFGSYINFYKCFRKSEGCSPEVWRQNHR
ncbi:MAG: helix-turn-helix transcriptional regulator [Ruminococcaceae bacterium]|nr:helix-turn-helix transcriptional regulator [Oscillospiraceae bacterium]